MRIVMTVDTKILALSRVTLFLVVLLVCFNARSTDLGVIGKTYPISEMNFLDYVQLHLEEEARKGRVEMLNNAFSENAQKYAKSPPGLTLPRATEYSARDYDPTFVINGDIADHEGKILYRSGESVNPLDHKDWSKSFCFFDGNDEEQVDWVMSYCGDPQKAKLILIDGPVYKLMEEFKNNRFFFDQKQKLTNRFDIRALPTVVRQSGRVLVVEEFPIEN